MTPRLRIDGAVLRPWTLTDAETLVTGWLDPDVAAWNSVPSTPTVALATHWIAGVQDRAANRQSIDWVIQSHDTNGVVGEVGLSGFSDAHRGALIGYWLLPAGRGHGRATAAVSAVTKWAHQALSLDATPATPHHNKLRPVLVIDMNAPIQPGINCGLVERARADCC